jgi:hypothetical protein
MATYEAVFLDGTIAAFEADSMSVEHGVVVLTRSGTTACAIGTGELLFMRDVNVPVELNQPEPEWEEDEA